MGRTCDKYGRSVGHTQKKVERYCQSRFGENESGIMGNSNNDTGLTGMEDNRERSDDDEGLIYSISLFAILCRVTT